MVTEIAIKIIVRVVELPDVSSQDILGAQHRIAIDVSRIRISIGIQLTPNLAPNNSPKPRNMVSPNLLGLVDQMVEIRKGFPHCTLFVPSFGILGESIFSQTPMGVGDDAKIQAVPEWFRDDFKLFGSDIVSEPSRNFLGKSGHVAIEIQFKAESF